MSRLALILSFLALASSTVHIAIVKHDRCLEHGELVERTAAEAHHVTSPTDGWHAGADDERHDEHCPLASPSTAPFSFHADTVTLDLIGALARQALAPTSVAHQSVDSLDVAPKQGPPLLEA